MAIQLESSLKKSLGAMHLWGIAVGLVISGEYFGWSYGWGIAGTLGFLLSTLFVAIMYTTFVFSFTELTTAIPNAGGPFVYVTRALGPKYGRFVGYASLFEFLFASPAIAFSLGSYLHFVYPSISTEASAMAVLVIFTGVNLLGVKITARFELLVTCIAVIELLVFIGITLPFFRVENFVRDSGSVSISRVFAAIPYAIWFFLAIEGVAMSAEEVKNPKKDIPIGYISAILTLVVLSFGVMLAAGGVGDWKKLSQLDYPVPEAMAMALGRENRWVRLLAGIGIFGLIASLNGIIYSSSRQIFALARSGYLPKFFSGLSSKSHVPQAAIVLSCVVGCIALYSGKTQELIILSALGAVTVYILSTWSLFILRHKEPSLVRSFRVPYYPYFPTIALISSSISLCFIVYYNIKQTLIFGAILGGSVLLHKIGLTILSMDWKSSHPSKTWKI